MKRLQDRRSRLTTFLAVLATVLGGAASGLGTCGPFSDVAEDAFCPFVLEIFYLGITTGTTPTTYDPASNVSRLQMAAFLSRTVDGVLKRGSRRAALDQFWAAKPQYATTGLGMTTIAAAIQIAPDGADLWVATRQGTVSRVRGSDGRLLETWTGANQAWGILSAMGRVFVAEKPDFSADGRLFSIDPAQPPGAVTTVASAIGGSWSLAFDGSRIWASRAFPAQGISIVTPGPTLPWSATTVSSADIHSTGGLIFDGSNIWVPDGAGTISSRILKLDSNGSVLQVVTLGSGVGFPVFDGSNIWVPGNDSVSVVRAATGAVLATVSSTGGFRSAAFDGERVLLTTQSPSQVALYKAASIELLGTATMGFGFEPYAVCSDGINFWLTLGANGIGRF